MYSDHLLNSFLNIFRRTVSIGFTVYFLATPLMAQNVGKTAMVLGKVVYEQNCLTCHQTDGSGVPRLYPPLIKSATVAGNPNKLIGIILNGLEGVEINGSDYSSAMPGFSASLTDKQIADLSTYLRQSFLNKASLVTQLQVKAVRSGKIK